MNECRCSNVRDPENRSKKDCCCGHNYSNAERNKNHHSTFKKLLYRKSRKIKEKIISKLLTPKEVDPLDRVNFEDINCGDYSKYLVDSEPLSDAEFEKMMKPK